MPRNFMWAPGQDFPSIEQHSARKLDVVKDYLDVYFDTVVPNPATDRLNITLVDGFCGGGKYEDNGRFDFGSPIILLNAVEAARERLNNGREKPLEINARFFFIDAVQNHVETLRQVLVEEGFGDRVGRDISLVCAEFADELPRVIHEIKQTQRVGRSIFLLDQFGYSDVPMASISSIFANLERPEVLLTFAIDGLLNYLQESSADAALYNQFGVDKRFIEEWENNKSDEALGRLITQRMLMSNIQVNSGAEFFTPFMLWSRTDNRWMMLAHLSRHQAARDKMLGVHWNIQNSFRHIGRGSLFALGFDTRLLESKDSLFSFSDQDKITLGQELTAELPAEIRACMTEGSLVVGSLLNSIGNRTAATNQDIFQAIEDLALGKEIEVASSSGSRKRPGSKIKIRDQLILPRQKTLFKL